jgi:cell division protein FtsB
MSEPAQPTEISHRRRFLSEALLCAILVAVALELIHQRYYGERLTHRIDQLQEQVEHLTHQVARPQGAQ